MKQRTPITLSGSLLLLLLVVTGSLQAQSPASQLATLTRVWATSKYYSHNVSTGQYNWDTTFLNAASRILASRKYPVINAEVQHLLTLAGHNPEPAIKLYDSMAIMYRNYDTLWIGDDRNLSDTQRLQLYHMLQHPTRQQNYYVRTEASIDSVYAPNHENAYTQSPYPDAPYRLLSLARFWGCIQYFFPYKYLQDKPWVQSLEPLTDVFLNAKDGPAYQRALAQMTATVNDAQTTLLPENWDAVAGHYPAPFTVYIVDNKAVVTSISDSNAIKGTEIKPGVVIDEMDGTRIADRIRYLAPYIPSSTPGTLLRDMAPLLLRSDKQDASLVCYTKEGRKFKAKFKRPDKASPAIDTLALEPAFRILDNNIGYIRFSQLRMDNTDSVFEAMMKTKAILFDMREPVTDTAALYEVPRYLLTDMTPYAFVTAPYFPLPGTFHYQLASHGADDNHYIGLKANPDHYPGKIVLLVDEHTQDLAEWAAMLMQASRRATVIGTQSAGAVGPVTTLPLADGHQVAFTAQGSYALNGNVIQRKGISLSVPVSVFIIDVQNNRDVILQKALDFVNNNP